VMHAHDTTSCIVLLDSDNTDALKKQ
jgi:hypothetical protein